ncbi:hypothetical protein [Fluviicola chungangensis]|uniref:Lipocalin family protein n=1 Tax=Fluviicola chungangensis TaxID=2597671 RepID=A0A556N6C8_9FLAO|nr:hypothetical protein [Fluviicola chungangensis]TSJ47727.1 hypothetical protein FO442_00950 [Fluviicola chungangensis]
MKHILYLFLAVGLITSCSKEKKALKSLGGETWVMTKSTYEDTGNEDLSGIRRAFTFDKCKPKDQPCSGTFVYQIPEFNQDLQWTITYTLSDDADHLTIVRTPSNFQGTVQTDEYDVLQLKKTFMELKNLANNHVSEWNVE